MKRIWLLRELEELRDYFKDHTAEECAEKFGAKSDTILKICKRNGFKHSEGYNMYEHIHRKDYDYDAIEEYYKTHTLADTARHFHVRNTLMSNIVHRKQFFHDESFKYEHVRQYPHKINGVKKQKKVYKKRDKRTAEEIRKTIINFR